MDSIITTRFYTVDSIQINVAEIGTGEPLVFIHGWSNNWQGWTLLAYQLAPFYKLYLIDLPGFGDSGKLPEYTIDSETDVVARFIKMHVGKPKALIGASLGTILTANVLKRYPNVADRAVLLGTIFQRLSYRRASRIFKTLLRLSNKADIAIKAIETTVKAPYTAYLVEKFLNAYKFNKELVDKYSLPGRKKINGKSYVQLGNSASSFVIEDFFRDCSQNVLLIYGEADKYVRPHHAKEILEGIHNPHVRMRVIAKSGHNPAYEQPEVTARVIREFLSGSVFKTSKSIL